MAVGATWYLNKANWWLNTAQALQQGLRRLSLRGTVLAGLQS